MVLVISELEDKSSIWLISEFIKRGLEVEHIFPDELIIDSELSLYISKNNQLPKLQTKDGRRIDSSRVNLIINRIPYFPKPYNLSDNNDIIYAAEEIRAAIVPWLRSFSCPIYNKPHPYSSFGLLMHDIKWKSIAHKFGLNTAYMKLENDLAQVSNREVIHILALGNQIISIQENIVPKEMALKILKLSTFLDQSLIEYEFYDDIGTLKLMRGNTFPDLEAYGQKLIDSLISEM